jgi:DNA repair protein RecO (recombination protein O)
MSERPRAASAQSPAARRAPAPSRSQLAFVLHAYDWSESSLILDLYTRDEGRLVAAAKGAKRPYSQLRPVLLPFQCVQVQLSRSRTSEADDEVRTLRAAEWAPGAPVLPSAALLSAYYLNELLMKFLPRGAVQAELFDGYRATLAELAQPQGDLQAALRAFELSLLQELGLLPDLAQDALSAHVLAATERYTWRPELGLVRASDADEALEGQDWIGLQAALMSGSAAALRQACQGPRIALRSLLRTVLAYHLAGASLRTRDLMQSLRRLGALATTGTTP